jgi:hypothetical protein
MQHSTGIASTSLSMVVPGVPCTLSITEQQQLSAPVDYELSLADSTASPSSS